METNFEPNSQPTNLNTQNPNPGIWSKFKKAKFAAVIIIAVAIGYFGGYKIGIKGYVFVPKEFKIINKANQPQNVDYQLLWDAIGIIQDKYVETAPNPQEFLYGAIKGAVASCWRPLYIFF